MKISDKQNLENLTLWTMACAILFIVLFFIGYAINTLLDLDPDFGSRHRETEGAFVLVFIAFVILFCAAILNISLNISLIAGSRKIEHHDIPRKYLPGKKIAIYFICCVVVFYSLFYFANYYRRNRDKEKIITESAALINCSPKSLDKIAASLSDTSKIKEVPLILKYLESQSENLHGITVITSKQFNGDPVILEVLSLDQDSAYMADLTKPLINEAFYSCPNVDRKILNSFFAGKSVDRPFWSTDNDGFKYYYPVVNNGQKFVLIFTEDKREI